jgi:hypothetical protein
MSGKTCATVADLRRLARIYGNDQLGLGARLASQRSVALGELHSVREQRAGSLAANGSTAHPFSSQARRTRAGPR